MSNQIPQRLLDLIKSDGLELLECELECLNDPARLGEAIDMIDDWEARCSLSGYARGEIGEWLLDRDMGLLTATEKNLGIQPPSRSLPTLASVVSPEWAQRLREMVNQQGINVLEWETSCACGAEILKIIELADRVAQQWLDVRSEVYATACHQMRVVCYG